MSSSTPCAVELTSCPAIGVHYTVRWLKIWIPRQEAERIVGKPLKESIGKKPGPEGHWCEYSWGSVEYIDGSVWMVVGDQIELDGQIRARRGEAKSTVDRNLRGAWWFERCLDLLPAADGELENLSQIFRQHEVGVAFRDGRAYAFRLWEI